LITIDYFSKILSIGLPMIFNRQ